jgi:hypothetical protein
MRGNGKDPGHRLCVPTPRLQWQNYVIGIGSAVKKWAMPLQLPSQFAYGRHICPRRWHAFGSTQVSFEINDLAAHFGM